MTLRIGWISPLTTASGVGTFSHAIARHFPKTVGAEAIDLTLLYPEHAEFHQPDIRSVKIEDTDSFRSVLELFDLLVYNIGNNAEHHDTIFRLLRTHPGIIISHDFVYQHYLAARSLQSSRDFASFAALLMKFGGGDSGSYLARSRITNRFGKIRYSPWDSDASAAQPMSESILDLGSALVMHSRFAQDYAEKRFRGPILRLGMPHDQKPPRGADTWMSWSQAVPVKPTLHMVSFGHIQSTKCTDLVLEALASSKILRRRVQYTVVGFIGDLDYLRRLEETVAAAGLRDVVRFETGVSELRLADIMSDADLFINLRRPNTEGSSASLIEQLDSGRPVVVLDSGCYAEIDSTAAVKLFAKAGAEDIRSALERLVGTPELLPVIGGAGRTYARTWTCADYGRRLIEFALEHRDLLGRRGEITGLGGKPYGTVEACDELWAANLAQARAAMRYLDRNVLTLDPQLLMRLGENDLCVYVAHVIFGIFDDPCLHRTLARFFVGRKARDIYWACVRFSLIVKAVSTGDDGAREQLEIIGPCYDVELWNVLECLPFNHYVRAGALTILGRAPSPHELTSSDESASCDRFSKRQALLEIVKQSKEESSSGASRLRQWLEQPPEQQFGSDLSVIECDLECKVGSAEFRERADLSGFYPEEADHAWTRGSRGFIGLRLGSGVEAVEALVRNINVDAEHRAVIKLSSRTMVAEVEVGDREPHLLTLRIPQHLARPDATVWLQLSTDRAGRPIDSADTRTLGVCLMSFRVVTRAKGAAEMQNLDKFQTDSDIPRFGRVS